MSFLGEVVRSSRVALFLLPALFLMLPSGAVAQILSCTTSATGVKFRPESLTDLIGDVLVECVTSGAAPPGQSYLTTDIRVAINTNLTNRIGVAGGEFTSDAVLIVNENHAPPVIGSTLGGPAGNQPVPQLGEFISNDNRVLVNSLQWPGVQLPIPGARAPDGRTFPSRTRLRITNLRVNPSQLGVSSTFGESQVQLATITIADAAVVPGATEQLVLGTLKRSYTLQTSFQPPRTLPQCVSQNIVNGSVSGTPTFNITLTEGFEYAFRPLGEPSTGRGVHTVESGYPIPGLGANGGGAEHGTRLALFVPFFPNGVRVSVPTRIVSGALELQLVRTNTNGGGPYNPVEGSAFAEVGSGMIAYEVVGADPTVVESVAIPVTVGYAANPAADLPSPGEAASVSVGLAPFSTIVFGVKTSPTFVPGSAFNDVFVIARCQAAPVLRSLSPSSVAAGQGIDVTITAAGDNLASSAIVEWNGEALSTSATSSGGVPALRVRVPARLLASPGQVQITVLSLDGKRSNALQFALTAAEAPAILSVGSAATGEAALVPGSLASLYGTTLSTSTAKAASFPLPDQLGGTMVTVNGRRAPLLFVSPTQINFQVPFEAAGSATLNVQVSRSDVTSPVQSVPTAETQPGIFRSGAQPIVIHVDYSLVNPARPAAPGEVLLLYGTGLGALNNAPATGSPAGTDPLSTAGIVPTLTLGGLPSEILFAGLAPGFAGLAQINFRVPADVSTSPIQELVLAFGNVVDRVTIEVARPAADNLP